MPRSIPGPTALAVVSLLLAGCGGDGTEGASIGDSDVSFDSGTLEPRGVYALKPTRPGTLTYHCTIHGTSQSGVLTVTR